jgi:uncharacterized repeat protein (TIGR01451 family)
VTGETNSPNFPITTGAYQTSFGGNTDAFVTKFNDKGDTLLFSTFLGGPQTDRAASIAIDASTNVYVTGDTSSGDYFPHVNALPGHDHYAGGQFDAFVTKFSPTGAGPLLFSTFLGGTDRDRGNAIAVNSTHVYVAGYTASSGGFSGTFGGEQDAFVVKFSSAGGASPTYATYLGGRGADSADAIAIDSAGNAFVTGVTESDNFPRVNALADTQGGTYNGGEDAFVTAYNANGSRYFSTYLGGSLNDKGSGIGLDNSGNVYVAGQTQSSDFPHVNAFPDIGSGGLTDVFLAEIAFTSPPSLEYSTYIGGGGSDLAYDLAVSGGGTVYLTGDTSSDYPNNFPVTGGTFQRGGAYDAFLMRVGSTQADISVEKLDDHEPIAVGEDLGYTITVRNYGPDPTDVTLRDPLSLYVTYKDVTTDTGTCSYDAPTRTVNCDFGEMIAGGEAIVHLIVTVPAMTPTGAVSNTAYVTGTEFDPNVKGGIHPNQYLQYTPINAVADLEVTKLADSYRVRENRDVTFTISIHNLGPGSASSVDLTDLLDSRLTWVSDVAPTGTTYDHVSGVWAVGLIPPKTTKTLTIVAHVGYPGVGTIITNAANNLHALETDPVPGNNSSTVNLRVVTDFPENGCHPSPTNPNEVICLTH